jgi:hypothetical protein
MNGPTTERLYNLLPAVYRLRDTTQGEPLRALLAVVERELQALEEDIVGLYDNWFIETCDEWVVPYIGDLLGAPGLSPIGVEAFSQRAYIANTLAYRRRKGTAAVLEQLARDVTGWPARAVEFFRLLATTQYLNHVQLMNVRTPDLRDTNQLERLGSPFEHTLHTAEVRGIARQRGRYNIAHVGIFLWRLHSYPLTNSPAFQRDARRYLFSPLGNNSPLFHLPHTEDEITHLAEPVNVPTPISRLMLKESLDDYYGAAKSLLLMVGEAEVPANQIVVCDLSDQENGEWAHQPQDKIAIDPVLGRMAFPRGQEPPARVRVSFHYGFSADMGGGEYTRVASFDAQLQPIQRVPAPHNTIQDALNAVESGGVVEIADSGRYAEKLTTGIAAGRRIELRAADAHRPIILLTGDWQIIGGEAAEITLNGLLISGGSLRVAGALRRLRLRHCTLLPGLVLSADGTPQLTSVPSVVIESTITQVEIDRCIVGGVRAVGGASVRIADSIVDATDETEVAYAAPDASGAGGPLQIENSTIIGKVHTLLMTLASNTIFLAGVGAQDAWAAPVLIDKRQQGCIRFSFIPEGAHTPRRHRCQPDLAVKGAADSADQARIRARLLPGFTSLRYGQPGYGQLSLTCPSEIRTGAEDSSEMGAFCHLKQPQREANLRASLEDNLRFGLEADIFYVT